MNISSSFAVKQTFIKKMLCICMNLILSDIIPVQWLHSSPLKVLCCGFLLKWKCSMYFLGNKLLNIINSYSHSSSKASDAILPILCGYEKPE